jgi:CheY-like chemotaxis protein
MAPVRNAVEIMASIAPEDPKLCWAIGVVDRQSRHMARLLDDLLDVSRIVCGKLALDLRRCPLAAIVESAVDAARPLIAARQHRFDLELPDEPLYLEADSTRLSQVLTNLLNNAALYTPDGGRIRLCAQGQDERILIRVIDNGEGIAPELRARLFEAFTQGPRPLDRAPGGLGLGLVIAARLTTLHGGHIEAHSDGPGQGAEFRLSLPRTAPESAARVPAAHAEQPIAAALKILVVDDNAEVAQGMAALLEHLGQQVAVALSGVEAIAIAPRFSPRLVLIDFGMAGMDGFETAQRLRTLEPDPQRMRLVGVSGYSDARMQEMGRRAGLDQQLIKPVGRDILAELLRRIAASSPPGAPPPDRIGT